MGHVAGATLHADGYTGRAKLVVDEDRHVVVGATFVGQDTAELLHAATIAIVCNGFGSRHHRPRPIVHDPEFITSAVSPSYHGDCCGRSGDQRPADRDERHGGSVAGHAAVDVHAPAVDSAFEIGDAPEPGGLQLPRGEHAASSPMAIHHYFTLPVE